MHVRKLRVLLLAHLEELIADNAFAVDEGTVDDLNYLSFDVLHLDLEIVQHLLESLLREGVQYSRLAFQLVLSFKQEMLTFLFRFGEVTADRTRWGVSIGCHDGMVCVGGFLVEVHPSVDVGCWLLVAGVVVELVLKGRLISKTSLG